jgi:hypothetical protein
MRRRIPMIRLNRRSHATSFNLGHAVRLEVRFRHIGDHNLYLAGGFGPVAGPGSKLLLITYRRKMRSNTVIERKRRSDLPSGLGRDCGCVLLGNGRT